MRRIWKIAVREYLATVRTKAFIISIVLMPIMMGAGIPLTWLSEKLEDQSEKKYVVIDRTPGQRIAARLQEAAKDRNEHSIIDDKTGERKGHIFVIESVDPSEATPEAMAEQRLELSERIRKGELVGVLEIGPKAARSAFSIATDLFSNMARNAESKEGSASGEQKKEESEQEWANDPAAVRYQAKPTATGAREFYQWALVEVSLALAGAPRLKEDIRSFKPPIAWIGLAVKNPQTGKIEDDEGMVRTAGPTFTAIGLVMLMFMIVMVGATPLMHGVLEEKLNKIAEVLLGSVSPFDLMAGKLLGGVGISLTLAAVYLGGAYWALWHFELADLIKPGIIAWFVLFLILSLIMNGAAFIAVGAACNDMKDPATLMLPVMIPTMIPMFLLGTLLRQPDGMVVKVVSYFPPATPMFMIGRGAMSATIAWWEPVLGTIVVVATTALYVWAAGRIFRVGLLMQGKTPSFKQLMGWIWTS